METELAWEMPFGALISPSAPGSGMESAKSSSVLAKPSETDSAWFFSLSASDVFAWAWALELVRKSS